MVSKSIAAHQRQRSTVAATADAAQAAFSRSTGLPDWMGKSTADLRAKVPDSVKEDFVRLAREVGSTESELLRDMVMVRLYGKHEVQRMHALRLAMVAGTEHVEGEGAQ